MSGRTATMPHPEEPFQGNGVSKDGPAQNHLPEVSFPEVSLLHGHPSRRRYAAPQDEECGEAAKVQSSVSRAAMLGDLELVFDLSGALWLPQERVLVVADLHLEKGASFARRGQMLPPYDSAATLAALSLAVARHNPRCIIALGDSFHRRDSSRDLDEGCRASIAAMQAGREWLWITGNHDPLVPEGLGGTSADALVIRGVTLRHEPDAGEAGFEIAGHLHPAAKVRLRGRSIRRRCFAMSAGRCILPAMGAYAGGLNLMDSAFSPFLGCSLTAHMLGESRVFSVARAMLLPD